jgi:23S rRNA pseudouridine2605 synthase
MKTRSRSTSIDVSLPRPRSTVPASRRTPRDKPNVSLARALSKLGVCSRREARDLIAAGRVAVNGRVLTNAEVRVDPDRERIALDGRLVRGAARRYLVLNKPVGLVVTRSDERGRATVYTLLDPADRGLFPVGRLDRDSAGLLLFTNDTQWANALLDPASKLPKAYQVQIESEIADAALARLRAGVLLDDGVRTRPALVERLARAPGVWLTVTLTEGRNRQVRRMLAAVGQRVIALIRTRIGRLALGGLAAGQVRPLTPHEVQALDIRKRRG